MSGTPSRFTWLDHTEPVVHRPSSGAVEVKGTSHPPAEEFIRHAHLPRRYTNTVVPLEHLAFRERAGDRRTIKQQRFFQCALIGPVLLYPIEDEELYGQNANNDRALFWGSLDDMLISTQPDDPIPEDAIALYGCEFHFCAFVDVRIMVAPGTEVDWMRWLDPTNGSIPNVQELVRDHERRRGSRPPR